MDSALVIITKISFRSWLSLSIQNIGIYLVCTKPSLFCTKVLPSYHPLQIISVATVRTNAEMIRINSSATHVIDGKIFKNLKRQQHPRLHLCQYKRNTMNIGSYSYRLQGQMDPKDKWRWRLDSIQTSYIIGALVQLSKLDISRVNLHVWGIHLHSRSINHKFPHQPPILYFYSHLNLAMCI